MPTEEAVTGEYFGQSLFVDNLSHQSPNTIATPFINQRMSILTRNVDRISPRKSKNKDSIFKGTSGLKKSTSRKNSVIVNYNT